jgi:hypothetical protein
MRTRYGPVAALLALAALAPDSASASVLSGDALDGAATVIAWFVILFVPIIVIGLFLLVHVLPEKIAERNHHPQVNAIKTLCFLSLVFGGMLWPLAWLWAFTRPVGFKAVYGTEKHETYFVEMGERAARGELDASELEHLKEELDNIATRGPLPAKLRHLPGLIAQAQPKAPATPAPEAGRSA